MSLRIFQAAARPPAFCLRFWLVLWLIFVSFRLVHADQPVRIASIFSLSGPAAATNAPSVDGVRWAVEEINAGGGILGRKLSLLEIDNLSTPIGAKVAADQAVEKEVSAIIGPAFSSHSMAVARVAQARGIPMISNIATHPGLTGIGDYIFRVCFNDLRQGRSLAEFSSRQLKAGTVVICFDMANDYSLGLSNTFQTIFQSLGGTVLGRIPYKPRQSDFRDTAALIRQLDPDVLFIPGYDESSRIIMEADRMKLRAIPVGGDGWDSESFFRLGGNQIRVGFYATHWSPAIETARSRAFVDRYGSRATLLAPAALSYDAVHLLADAMARAGTSQPSAIRDALAATRSFEGVTGDITFDQGGDPAKRLVMMEIQNGRPHYRMQVSATP